MLARLLALWLALSPVLAFAQSAVLNGFPPGTFQSRAAIDASSALPGPPVKTFIGVGSCSNVGSVSTCTGVSIGSASGFTTRRIIIEILSQFINSGFSSVLVNGTITPTQHCSIDSGGGANATAVFSADIPTGTTANIVITQGSTAFSPVIVAIYTVDDALLVSTTPSSATGFTAGAASITTSNITQQTGGFTVAAVQLAGTAGGTGTAISGFTNDALGTSGSSNAIASTTSIASPSTSPLTANYTTSQAGSLCASSWR